MDTNKEITHLSLCSGYEGIGHGLRRVLPNLREIAFVEREGFPIANLENKMQKVQLDTAPIHTDLKTFPYRKFRGCVDILSGGFPCQPFSAAGKRQATEDPRHLFPYIAEGIRECQPRIVFLENVQGILSCTTGDGEPVLQYVLRTLEGMGYRATAGIFSAEEVGAPHQRKRVFILGYSQHNGCSAFKELRGNEEASDQWTKEESSKTRESEGASRPIDVPSVQGCTEGSKSEELGYSSSNGRKDGCSDARGEERQSQEGWMQEPQRGSNATTELADSNDCGSIGGNEIGSDQVRKVEQHSTEGEDSSDGGRESEELADCKGEGLEGHPRLRSEQDRRCEPSSQGLWPSRPEEPQYEWEEPRVVADTKSQQGSSTDNGGEPRASSQSEEVQLGGGHSGSLRKSNWQTEPQLGGATDGSSSRVDATVNRIDRLRLLGNGVVPMTAAKAFVTLIQRVI